jgi:hypothetical protein
MDSKTQNPSSMLNVLNVSSKVLSSSSDLIKSDVVKTLSVPLASPEIIISQKDNSTSSSMLPIVSSDLLSFVPKMSSSPSKSRKRKAPQCERELLLESAKRIDKPHEHFVLPPQAKTEYVPTGDEHLAQYYFHAAVAALRYHNARERREHQRSTAELSSKCTINMNGVHIEFIIPLRLPFFAQKPSHMLGSYDRALKYLKSCQEKDIPPKYIVQINGVYYGAVHQLKNKVTLLNPLVFSTFRDSQSFSEQKPFVFNMQDFPALAKTSVNKLNVWEQSPAIIKQELSPLAQWLAQAVRTKVRPAFERREMQMFSFIRNSVDKVTTDVTATINEAITRRADEYLNNFGQSFRKSADVRLPVFLSSLAVNSVDLLIDAIQETLTVRRALVGVLNIVLPAVQYCDSLILDIFSDKREAQGFNTIESLINRAGRLSSSLNAFQRTIETLNGGARLTYDKFHSFFDKIFKWAIPTSWRRSVELKQLLQLMTDVGRMMDQYLPVDNFLPLFDKYNEVINDLYTSPYDRMYRLGEQIRQFVQKLKVYNQARAGLLSKRDQPFSIIFSSSPQIGKSVFSQHMALAFHKVFNLKSAPFTRAANIETWDGYNPELHDTIIYDEFGQNRETITDILEYIMLVSRSPFPCSMASLVDSMVGIKGTMAVPKVVICNTNATFFMDRALTAPGAVIKRTNLFVHMEADNGVPRVGFNHIKFNVYVPDHTATDGRSLVGTYHYKEFMSLVMTSYKAHFEKEKLVTSYVNSDSDGFLADLAARFAQSDDEITDDEDLQPNFLADEILLEQMLKNLNSINPSATCAELYSLFKQQLKESGILEAECEDSSTPLIVLPYRYTLKDHVKAFPSTSVSEMWSAFYRLNIANRIDAAEPVSWYKQTARTLHTCWSNFSTTLKSFILRNKFAITVSGLAITAVTGIVTTWALFRTPTAHSDLYYAVKHVIESKVLNIEAPCSLTPAQMTLCSPFLEDFDRVGVYRMFASAAQSSDKHVATLFADHTAQIMSRIAQSMDEKVKGPARPRALLPTIIRSHEGTEESVGLPDNSALFLNISKATAIVYIIRQTFTEDLVELENKAISLINAVHIKDSHYLFPRHFFMDPNTGKLRDFDNPRSKLFLRFFLPQSSTSYAVPITTQRLKFSLNYDYAVFDTSGTSLPLVKSTYSKWITEADLPSLAKFDGVLISSRQNSFPVVKTVSMFQARINYEMVDYTGPGGTPTYLARSVRYSTPTQKGDCGSVIINEKMSGGKLVGIHIWGTTYTRDCGGVIITRELLDDLIPPRTLFPIPSEISEEYPLSGEAREAFGLKMDFVGTLPRPVHVSRATDFVRTPLVGAPVKFPSVKEMDVDPLLHAIAGYEDDCHLDLSYDDSEGPSKVCSDALVLTPDEAINVHGNMDKINLTTSPGYPYTLKGMRKRCFVDDSQPTLKLKENMLKAVQDLQQQCHTCVPPVIWIAFLKDELLKPGKMCRTIQIPPMEHTILMRMYFGSWISYMQGGEDRASMIGMNPESIEWDNLLNDLLKVSSVGIAADRKGWDKKYPAAAKWAALKWINEWYQLNSPSWKPIDDLIRSNLIGTMMWALVAHNHNVYRITNGMMSGCAITAALNTKANELLDLRMFYEEAPLKYLTRRERLKVYSPYLYGDDNITAINAKEVPHIHGQYMARFWKYFYGVDLTSDIKERSLGPHFDKVVDMTFLKRGTRHNGVVYVPLLSKDSIESMLYWVRVGPNSDLTQQFEINAITALRFAYFWGPEYYNILRTRLAQHFGDLPSYQYYDTLFLNENLLD